MDKQSVISANNKIFSQITPIIPTIQKVLVLYIILFTISPPLQLDNIYRIMLLGAVAFWFLLNIPHRVKFQRIHALAFIFAALVFVIAAFESQGDWNNLLRPINLYLIVICFLMAYCYKDRWHELSWIVPIVLILLTFFNFKTYSAIIENPDIARLIVRDDPSTYAYYRQGVGGYGLMYSQVCALPMIVAWTFNAFRNGKIKFVIGFIWAISYFVFLFNSGYTIAAVASIAGIIILFFYRRKSPVLAVIITLLFILLMIRLIGYNTAVREWLLNFFDGTKVAKKIEDIYLSITTEETADSIAERISRYQASISAILRYPVIGGLWFRQSGGGHSIILDIFAKYGLFGGYVFIKMAFGFTAELKKYAQTIKDYRIANALFVVALTVFLLDAFPLELAGMYFLVIPICYNDISVRRKKT